MKKIDLSLNIDPAGSAYNNLKKVTTAFEALAVVMDTLEVILKELSANLGDFGKKFSDNQKNIEKFAETLKNVETSGIKVADILKTISDRVEDIAKKLDKIK